MSRKQYTDVGADRAGEAGVIDPERAVIIEIEDAKHPKHKFYTKRLDPDRPDIQALAESMFLLGWPKGSIAWLYRDGERACVAAGRRRITAARIANVRRKEAKKPPIRVPFMYTTDPGMAEDIENAGRVDIPPLRQARDFVAAKEEHDGDEKIAAARVGITLEMAHQLEACLSLPADIRQKVNDREIPIDVAARMAKKGSGEARKVVDASADKSGKVDGEKARAAAKDLPKRAKTRPARVLEGVEAEVRRMTSNVHADALKGDDRRLADAAAVLAWARGAGEAPPWLQKAIDSAAAVKGAQTEAAE